MKKISKIALLCILSAATIQQTYCDNDHNIIAQFLIDLCDLWTGNGQKKPTYDAATEVTSKHYYEQWRYDLQALPAHEVEALIRLANESVKLLTTVEIRNTKYVNGILRGAIPQYIDNRLLSIFNAMEKRGIIIDNQIKTNIRYEYDISIRAILENTPNLNGNAIRQFFGDAFENEVRTNVSNQINAQYNNSSPYSNTQSSPQQNNYQPAPPAPPATQAPFVPTQEEIKNRTYTPADLKRELERTTNKIRKDLRNFVTDKSGCKDILNASADAVEKEIQNELPRKFDSERDQKKANILLSRQNIQDRIKTHYNAQVPSEHKIN